MLSECLLSVGLRRRSFFKLRVMRDIMVTYKDIRQDDGTKQ
jgi:hypothetical protein